MMGLLAQAKERQKQKLSKQFISFYDSVLYLGEPKDEALEFIIGILENRGVYLELSQNGLEEVQIQKNSDNTDTKYIPYSMEATVKDLKEKIFHNDIDKNSLCQRVGFAKKRFLEMLVNMGFPIDKDELKNVQSPDLVFYDNCFEVDYYTYELIVGERDELRERIENIENTPTDTQLLQQVADQQAIIDRQAKELGQLKNDYEALKQGYSLLETANKTLIEQAGKDTQSDTPTDNELLTAIYDDNKPYLYAPELHNAIEVWKLIYHDNLTSQHLTTHSDKFESAIKQLGIAFGNNAPKERLKQITTPQQQKEKTKSKNS